MIVIHISGPRGCGKTTVAKRIKASLDRWMAKEGSRRRVIFKQEHDEIVTTGLSQKDILIIERR